MKVRDEARRKRCWNNLKQLGLALETNASVNSILRSGRDEPTFPAGTISHKGLPPERRLSWVVGIVPYLESSTVYSQFDLTAPADTPRNRAAGDNSFGFFICPASPDMDRRSRAPVMYYVGMTGVGADAAELPSGDARAGMFGYDRRTAIADITDGTSSTIALIEVSDNPGRWSVGGPGTVRGLDPADAPYIGRFRPFGELHVAERSPFGPTRFAAPVLMADVSVRVLSERTAARIVEALATIAGKEEIPGDW
jgi:hypothetical protein